MRRSDRSKGFVLIAVSVALAFIGTAAFLANRQKGMLAADINRELDTAQAYFLARAAVAHATWKGNKANCNGIYPNISGSLPGQGTYSAAVSIGGLAPTTLNIAATGASNAGASYAISRTGTRPHNTTQSTTTYAVNADSSISAKDNAQMDKNYGTVNTITLNKQQKMLFDFPTAFYTYSTSTKDLILSEAFWLYQQNNIGAAPIPLNLYQVNKSWLESSVTWNARDKTTSSLWTTPGGDYGTQSLALAQVGLSAGWLTFDMTAWAEAWKNNNVATGYGFIVVPPSTNNSDIKFNASENAKNQPYITVTSLPSCL